MSATRLIRVEATSIARQRVHAFVELTKPRLAALVLATTAAGFWLGIRGALHGTRLLSTLVGTGLVVGGANALNQWMERDADALMQRTQHRPLPSGQLIPEEARRFGLILLVGGIVCLAMTVNILSATLAVIAAVSYLFLYTPLKRASALCTLVGAIAGALPPMIGWAAARNTLTVEAWILFVLLFVWQLPHFLAIAVLFREDYTNAGFQMLPVADGGSGATARQMTLYGLTLLPVSLFPSVIGLSGALYFYGALILSVAFLLLTLRSALLRSRRAAQQLFLGSVLYLPLLMMLLGWNKITGSY